VDTEISVVGMIRFSRAMVECCHSVHSSNAMHICKLSCTFRTLHYPITISQILQRTLSDPAKWSTILHVTKSINLSLL